MWALNINFFSEAHLDPDLQESVLIDLHYGRRGLFRQSDKAQIFLLKREINYGDIFYSSYDFGKLRTRIAYTPMKKIPRCLCYFGLFRS